MKPPALAPVDWDHEITDVIREFDKEGVLPSKARKGEIPSPPLLLKIVNG